MSIQPAPRPAHHVTAAASLVRWTAAAVGVIALAMYVRTLMPGVGFWDTGEAQTVPHTLSIFHPTGFPTYAMLGWLWSQIPVGEVAWRMNLLSAVCVAVSSGLVVLITGYLVAERHPVLRVAAAGIAGLAFAFSQEAWAIGVRADVHALNTLFVASIIWLLFRWREAEWNGERRPGRWLLAAALVFGIALGNHPLVGLLAFAIAAWLFIVEPGIWRRWRLVLGCAGLLAVGLATYLYIPARALTPPPPPLFYAHPTTLDRIRYLIFAEQFHGLFDFNNLLGTFPDKWRDASRILQEQFVGPGWLIVAIGAATLVVRQFAAFVFLSLVVVADVLYSMNFNDGDIGRYYVPAIVATAPLVGVAVAMIAGACARAAAESSRRFAGTAGRRRLATAASGVVVALAMLLPLGTVATNYAENDQSANRTADAWVDSVYAQLPRDSVLISWWSYSTPLWYRRWVDGDRPDVLIIDERNIIDDGYVTIDAAIRAWIGRRPVFVVPPDWEQQRLLTFFQSDWLTTVPGYSAIMRMKES